MNKDIEQRFRRHCPFCGKEVESYKWRNDLIYDRVVNPCEHWNREAGIFTKPIREDLKRDCPFCQKPGKCEHHREANGTAWYQGCLEKEDSCK